MNTEPSEVRGDVPEPGAVEANENHTISINRVNGRFLLYDVDTIMHVRSKWHMCGCLFGTLPQIPQQNVFLGLPLELMDEEVALLLEKGAATLVDDEASHERSLKTLVEADKDRYLARLREDKDQVIDATLRAVESKRKKFIEESAAASSEAAKKNATDPAPAEESSGGGLFDPETKAPTPPKPKKVTAVEPHFSSTPASTSTSTGYAPISAPTADLLSTTGASTRFVLYRHMHSKGYFLSPGLRFGCQFLAYPGDPLRFHSHFLANSLSWDEELSVMDLVGGGRLGTGVKKAWLIGGSKTNSAEGGESGDDGVRCFSVEWSAFG